MGELIPFPRKKTFLELVREVLDVVVERQDPIHQKEDGTWWFWTETWAHEVGPFASRKSCAEALMKYIKEVLGE